MNKAKLSKYFLALTILSVVIVFIYLIDKIYSVTLEDAKLSHQQQQMEMVKLVSEGIDYFLEHLIKDMKLHIANESDRIIQVDTWQSRMKFFRNNYDSTIVLSIFELIRNKHAFNQAGKTISPRIHNKIHKMIKDANKGHSKKNFLISEIFPDSSSNIQTTKVFLMIFATQKNKNLEKYVGYVINFDQVIKNFIEPLNLSSNDFVWIMDNEGRLIYHPRHKEMLFKSINNTGKNCLRCHTNFIVQKEMVRSEKPLFGEYFVKGDEPRKIFAFVPLNLGDKRWLIAISTFLPDVTNKLKSKFNVFFILGIVILISILVFVIIIYLLNIKRMKANEERKNLEKLQDYQEKLNHYSRLASIGELVDSVAHEMNTPAGIISVHSDLILLKENQSGFIKQELEIIKNQTRRISEYTKTLLNFSKRMSFNPEKTDIKNLINESLFLIHPKLKGKKIRIKRNYPEYDFFANVDQRQMEQVFINILNNAVDSIIKDGTISIVLSKIELNNQIKNVPSEEFLQIEISDSGCGMNKNDLEKIFDPFFSTKGKNGTGLGLSITKNIIQRHRGKIEVDSEINKGTTFRILLPTNGI
jgi:signal transduction histidine kinase